MTASARVFDLKRCRPVRDRAFRRGWAAAHPWCFCCGGEGDWLGLQVHHLVKPGRSDEAVNLMMLCDFCHRATHGAILRGEDGWLWPNLTLGMQFALKQLREPDIWDQARLEELWGRYLPDLEDVPDVYLEMFAARRLAIEV